MFPIFIFTGMGSEPQNAFLPLCGCFRRKQKQQMPCAAAALPVKKRIPENPQIFRNCEIINHFSAEDAQSNAERILNRPGSRTPAVLQKYRDVL